MSRVKDWRSVAKLANWKERNSSYLTGEVSSISKTHYKDFKKKLNWYSGGWSLIGSTRHCGHQWPIVPAPGDYDDGEIGGLKIGRGNRSTRRKPAPVPLCSTTNPTWCPDANPGRRCVKPATNRLSFGTPIYKDFNSTIKFRWKFYNKNNFTWLRKHMSGEW
jgi:hypothetical protein